MTTPHRLLLVPLALAAGCTLLNDPAELEPGPDESYPAQPQGLVASPGDGRMALRWSAVTDWDFDHYVVYSAETGQSLGKVGETGATTYTVQPLSNDVVYDFMVLAVDRFGNVSAPSDTVTAQPDGVAPTVGFAISPSTPWTQGAASFFTDVVVTFSEPMDVASVEAAGSIVGGAHTSLQCNWTWYEDDSVAKCDLVVDGDPGNPLSPLAPYTLTLAASATDRAGNVVAGTPVAYTFTTSDVPDDVPPGVSSVTVSSYQSATQAAGSVSPGPLGVFPETNVVVTFDEPMDPDATKGATSLTVGGSPIAAQATWNAGGDVLTFDPVSNPANGTIVTVTVGTGARDPAGNHLAVAVTRYFKMANTNTVSLEGDPARDGYVYHTGTSVSLGAPTGYIAVGDGTGAYSYRGFLSFNRAGLPQTPSRFTAATLAVDQYQVTGTPYDDLRQLTFCRIYPIIGLVCSYNDLLAVPVELDATGSAGLDALDYDGPAVSGSAEISTSASLGYRSASVLTAVEEDRLSGRSRSEWRLQFPVANDGGGDTDLVYLYPGEGAAGTRPTLTLTYEYP